MGISENTAEYVRRLERYLTEHNPSPASIIKKEIGCLNNIDFYKTILCGTYAIPGLYEEDGKGSGSKVVYGINMELMK